MIGYKYNLIMKDSSFDSILSDLLNGINVEEYNWIIMDCNICKRPETVFLNYDGRYTGKEFKKLLKELETCYIISINMQAAHKVINAVKDYDDYLSSECKLVILISDVAYNEIYCKPSELCEIIKSNCLKLDYDEFEVIDDDSDCRTVFRV